MRTRLVNVLVALSFFSSGQILTYSTTSNQTTFTISRGETLYIPINDTIYISGLLGVFDPTIGGVNVWAFAPPQVPQVFDNAYVLGVTGNPLPDNLKFPVRNYPFSVNYRTLYAIDYPGPGPEAPGNTASYSFYIRVLTGVGVFEYANVKDVVCAYPVPLTDKLHVQSPGATVYQLTISNALGVNCLEQEAQGPVVDISVAELMPGVYSLEVFESGRLVDKKRIVK